MADQTIEGKLSVTDKVGIGINEPIVQLHIFSSTAAPSQAFLESGGALLKLSVDASGAKLGTDNAFPLSILTDGSSRIAIDAVGNIGIGVPTPSTKLEVNGTVKATNFLGNGATLDGIVKKAGDTISGALSVQESLTVSGNVGIGTTIPSYKLAIVAGDINIDDGRALRQAGRWLIGGDSNVLSIGSADRADGRDIRFDSGFAGVLTIKKDTGNIGIGTMEPLNSLHVARSAHLNAIFDRTDTQDHLTAVVGSDGSGFRFSNSNFFFIGTQPYSERNDNGVGTELLRITSAGNVGIGTANPNLRLDVSGDWIGSSDNSQSLGGWRLGRWPANQPNEWVYLSRTDSTAYQDLAVKALWAGGALQFGSADDLAEMTPVKAEDHLEPGDVVVIDNPPDNRVLLAKSCQPYDSRVAGVIADPTTSGLIIGGSHPTDVNRDDLKPLALAGRVLTKVTLENGLINAGDYLTTSSTPGHAMKATSPGSILGKALQSFQSEPKDGINKIWVLINLG
jgi:hypothetical protein